jgi:hypothetical protein
MNIQKNETELRNTISIAIWENEGGAPGPDLMDHQYGRRVETDRSWTVYHVFTGVPGQDGADELTGLSKSQATSRMMSLNHRNAERRQERIKLSAFAPTTSGEAAERPS